MPCAWTELKKNKCRGSFAVTCVCVLLRLLNKTSILWLFRYGALSEVLGSIMLWLWCRHFLLSQGIKYSLTAARKTDTKISLSWLKLVLGLREWNYTLTSAALKPFCLCVVAPVPWTVGFAHWGPPVFLFSVFSIPAVADDVVTPVWADFPSSRTPSRDTWNWAINTEEQFITDSLCFSTFLVIAQVMEGAVRYYSESSLPPFVTFSLTLSIIWLLSYSPLHIETLAQKTWKTS